MTTIIGLAVLSLILFLAALVYAALIIASDADDLLDRHGLSDERLAQVASYGRQTTPGTMERGRQPTVSHPKPTGPVPIAPDTRHVRRSRGASDGQTQVA